jgi:5-hydroxyisourate hydrolase
MTISTHVLDTSIGQPAAAVAVQLLRQQGSSWIEMFRGETDAGGRVPALLPEGTSAGAGAYRLTFDVGGYFHRKGTASFYTTIAIDFTIQGGDAHYHVPLLVSPFGYSTYRGS